MRDTLAALITLQDVDCKLRVLEQSKGDLPQRIASLNQEIALLEGSISEKRNQLKSSQLGRESGALEVATLRDKLKKYQSQLYQVKTNKEYDAITLEIETTQADIEKREYGMLEMEETEKLLQSEIEGCSPDWKKRRDSAMRPRPACRPCWL